MIPKVRLPRSCIRGRHSYASTTGRLRSIRFFVLFCCLLGCILAASCASNRQSSEETEPLWGTWRNEELKPTYFDWRVIYSKDGTIRAWDNGRDESLSNTWDGRFTIAKKWVDAQGNSWYWTQEKSSFSPYAEEKAQNGYGLIKIHADGLVMEGEWSHTDFPAAFGEHRHYVFQRERAPQ